jgi:hypothetical protein
VELSLLRDDPNIGLSDRATAVRLSSAIRRETDASGEFRPVLTEGLANEVAGPERRMRGPSETLDDLLLLVAERVRFFGDSSPVEHVGAWVARLGLRAQDDLQKLLSEVGPLQVVKELSTPNGEIRFEILLGGWKRVQELQQTHGTGRLVFIAMSFDVGLNYVRDAIEAAVRRAGYEPLRVDRHEFVGGVMDEILAKIRQSKFVVADFTGNRGGVYYEAGFASGLGLRVVPLCQDTCLNSANKAEGLHFDVSHLNFLSWRPDALADLESRLQSRIERIFGRGPCL